MVISIKVKKYKLFYLHSSLFEQIKIKTELYYNLIVKVLKDT